MARFLVTCWPFVGHVYPQISVAHALRARGHEVAFYTHASVQPILAAEGFPLFPFANVNQRRFEHIHQLEANVPVTQPPLQTLGVALRAFSEMLADSIPEQVSDLQPIISRWNPDVLITDLSLWGPILVLWEHTGIPVALSSTMMGSMIPGPDAPPWGPGLPPPRSPWTRLLAHATSIGAQLVTASMRRRLDYIRAQYGLPRMGCSVNAFTGKLPLYLIPSLPELDYNRRDQPPTVHYIGPCVWTKPGAPPPEWLDQLPSDQPWVHATEGTAQYQQPFVLRSVIRGLANERAQVIVTTGHERDPASLDLGGTNNVHAARWISHDDLLPRCAALVTTGGPATVIASLKAGVPLVMVPTFWEKSDNAQRVVEAGVGLRMSPRQVTPRRMRAAVRRLLDEPRFRLNAQRIARRLADSPGPPRAAELLEDLARTRGAPAPLEAQQLGAG